MGVSQVRAANRAIAGLLVFVFIGGLAALAALVPVGHGFVPKGGGWFIPAVVGGAFTLHPLLIAVPWAACFVLGLFDWRRPWRVEHLDLLALAGFFPVAMLLSDDVPQAALWLAAACLGWLFARMLGAALGAWPMPELRPSISSRRLGLAILILLLARIGSVAVGNISDVGQASSLGAWRVLHGLHLYGAVSWQGPGGLRIYRPDSYGPFAYYAYIPFVAVFRADAARDAAAGVVLRRADARRTVHARPAARRAAPRASVRVRVRALPVSRPLLDGGDQRCADRRPLRLGNRRGNGAPGRSRAAHGSRRPDEIRPCPARPAIPGRQARALALRADAPRRARRDARLAAHHLRPGSIPRLDVRLPADTSRRRRAVQHLDLPAARGDRGKADTRRRAGAARALTHVRPPVQDAREHAALAAALLIGAQLLLGYWFYSYLTWCYPLLIIAIIQARSGHEGPARQRTVPQARSASPRLRRLTEGIRAVPQRASRGTSTCALGLPQPVTGSQPGPAW